MNQVQQTETDFERNARIYGEQKQTLPKAPEIMQKENPIEEKPRKQKASFDWGILIPIILLYFLLIGDDIHKNLAGVNIIYHIACVSAFIAISVIGVSKLKTQRSTIVGLLSCFILTCSSLFYIGQIKALSGFDGQAAVYVDKRNNEVTRVAISGDSLLMDVPALTEKLVWYDIGIYESRMGRVSFADDPIHVSIGDRQLIIRYTPEIKPAGLARMYTAGIMPEFAIANLEDSRGKLREMVKQKAIAYLAHCPAPCPEAYGSSLKDNLESVENLLYRPRHLNVQIYMDKSLSRPVNNDAHDPMAYSWWLF